jgi:hypothetical protein
MVGVILIQNNWTLSKVQKGIDHAINYINENGPYDGVLGFSQGCLIARCLLHITKLESKSVDIEYHPKFAILFSAGTYVKSNPFEEYPDDVFVLHSKYKVPVIYIYGTKDPWYERVK